MDKETKSVVFILITMLLNIVAPILLINTIRDYTKSSKVYGSPSIYEVSDYVSSSNYLFQENLSNISYTAETSGTDIKYTYNYYFESIDLDTTQNNYCVFVNDYICTTDNLDARSISSIHLHDFYDLDRNLINSVELTIEFKSYTTYTTLLITITAHDNDLSYWNNYCSNPGFVLTLSKVDYGMSGNLYTPIDPNTKYDVNFMIDNQPISSLSILFGECATLPDYELNNCSWSADGFKPVDVTTYQILTDTTFVLVYPFTITFDANGGTCNIENKSLYYSQSYGELPIPVREGYSFVGWYSEDGVLFTSTSIMLLQDVTLYAHWTSPLYNVICEYDATTSNYMVTGSEYDNATEINIPSTYDDGVHGVGFVTGIKDFAFNNCMTLINVSLPNTITMIGVSAFSGCKNLSNINLPYGLVSIGTRAFNQCSSLKSITIPTSLDKIGDYVFHYSGLSTIVIPNNIKSLGAYAFGFCKDLISVTFEYNSICELIGSGAFTECTSLSTIILPSSVAQINSGAFYNCTNLTTMTLQSITPPILSNTNAISNATITIYIVGDLNVYANASNWMKFADTFVEI